VLGVTAWWKNSSHVSSAAVDEAEAGRHPRPVSWAAPHDGQAPRGTKVCLRFSCIVALFLYVVGLLLGVGHNLTPHLLSQILRESGCVSGDLHQLPQGPSAIHAESRLEHCAARYHSSFPRPIQPSRHIIMFSPKGDSLLRRTRGQSQRGWPREQRLHCASRSHPVSIEVILQRKRSTDPLRSSQ
jgi:hypothetical protein